MFGFPHPCTTIHHPLSRYTSKRISGSCIRSRPCLIQTLFIHKFILSPSLSVFPPSFIPLSFAFCLVVARPNIAFVVAFATLLDSHSSVVSRVSLVILFSVVCCVCCFLHLAHCRGKWKYIVG
ncbi:unnamed protein product [Somion occarium]|uniref:Uncharacterized protein n=1 Tax=Somion occarium TaxID=3059160 RepID=A0ABP1CYV2_9APHY